MDTYIPDNAIAIIKYKSGKRRAICDTVLGGLYLEWIDYDGLFLAGATTDSKLYMFQWLFEDIKSGEANIIQSKFTLYHVFHICFCGKCDRVGGRAFDHSQASWDAHLRFVPPELIVDLPTGERIK